MVLFGKLRFQANNDNYRQDTIWLLQFGAFRPVTKALCNKTELCVSKLEIRNMPKFDVKIVSSVSNWSDFNVIKGQLPVENVEFPVFV